CNDTELNELLCEMYGRCDYVAICDNITFSFYLKGQSRLIIYESYVDFGNVTLTGSSIATFNEAHIRNKADEIHIALTDQSKMEILGDVLLDVSDLQFNSSSVLYLKKTAFLMIEHGIKFSEKSSALLSDDTVIECVESEGCGEISFVGTSQFDCDNCSVYHKGLMRFSDSSTMTIKQNSSIVIDGKFISDNKVNIRVESESDITVDGKATYMESCKTVHSDQCVVLKMSGTRIVVINKNITKTSLFQVNNGIVDIDDAISFSLYNDCFDMIYLGKNGVIKNNSKTSDEPNFSYEFNRHILRYCAQQTSMTSDVYCHLLGTKNGSMKGAFYNYADCPCQTTDDALCLVISNEKSIEMEEDEYHLSFVFNRVDVTLDNLGISRTVTGMIDDLIFSLGLTVQKGDADTMSVITKTGKIFLSNSIEGPFRPFQNRTIDVKNQITVQGNETEFSVVFGNGDNYVLYFKNINDLFRITFEELDKHILLIGENGIVVQGVYYLCSYGTIVDNNFTCLTGKTVSCGDGYYPDSDNNFCNRCKDLNCLHCQSDTCEECTIGYRLTDGICVRVHLDECLYYVYGHCMYCVTGGIVNGTCQDTSPLNGCVSWYEDKCYECNSENGYVLEDTQCVLKNNTILLSKYDVLGCSNGYYNNDSECELCSSTFDNCDLCTPNECIQCKQGYILSNGQCETMHCLQFENSETNDCVECENTYALTVIKKCTPKFIGCKMYLTGVCVECEKDYYLKNRICVSPNLTTSCSTPSPYGCLSCSVGYYLDDGKCQVCNKKCLDCVELPNECVSCSTDTFLKNHDCVSNIELDTKCETYLPNGMCMKCRNGYYMFDSTCYMCDTSCATCVGEANQCVLCNGTNYMRDGKCLPQSSIVGCNVTISPIEGCTQCQDGYFKNNKECQLCTLNCTTCDNPTTCSSCKSEWILQTNGLCKSVEYIEECLVVKDSRCVRCTFWHAPREDGSGCQKKMNGWAIGVFVVISCLVFSIMGSLFTTLIYCWFKAKKINIVHQNLPFKYKKSDVHFMPLDEVIGVSCENITFGIDKIPVDSPTTTYFYLCNNSKKKKKIQIMTNEGIDRYDIEISPDFFLLSRGEGIKIDFSITPRCTCSISEPIKIISSNTDGCEEIVSTLKVVAETMISTFLNYEELTEEEMVGRGSFGIVSRGKFQGRTVAIKKMLFDCGDELTTKEFRAEIQMLNKFRCQYIVYFYGAVLIKSRMCLV
ncbi:tyrosine kinase, putative, partial [Entamoeba invadens IP1]